MVLSLEVLGTGRNGSGSGGGGEAGTGSRRDRRLVAVDFRLLAADATVDHARDHAVQGIAAGLLSDTLLIPTTINDVLSRSVGRSVPIWTENTMIMTGNQRSQCHLRTTQR